MSEPSAKIIADSISPDGVRLTTGELRIHRFVLAEFNTHRVFSRNSASSRAIPVAKQLARVVEDPAIPVIWPAEKKGMQGGEPLPDDDAERAEVSWLAASFDARVRVEELVRLGVHKSVTNRLLEPFMWHTVVVTATAWQNFFAQRVDPDAQPEIHAAALAMQQAYADSEPAPLKEGQWHLPYVRFGEDDYDLAMILEEGGIEPTPETIRSGLAKVSAARCARTSYLTQDGRRDMREDLRLYERLTTDRINAGKAVHWSPLEHVATPWAANRQEGCIHFGQDENSSEDTFQCIRLDHLPRVGNLLGWRSLRTEVEATNHYVTYQ
jgi:thymidylate synthase ThyX